MKKWENGAGGCQTVGLKRPTSIEQMRAILADIESESLRHEERVKKRLQWEDWKSLLDEAVSFARFLIGIRFWRGEWGGTLPEGYDANSLASEAAATMLNGKSRLVFGWTRERLMRELKRLVSREVRRLLSLIEASRMRGEWDILPPDENDELQSIFDELEAATINPGEELVEKEGQTWWAEIKVEIDAYLNGDEGARKVFRCLCDDVFKRREIASRCGMSVRAVTAARKRLDRKMKEYFERLLTGLAGSGGGDEKPGGRNGHGGEKLRAPTSKLQRNFKLQTDPERPQKTQSSTTDGHG